MAKNIVGIWKMVRTESTGADGRPMPAPYGGAGGLGIITFTADGRMACVLCDSRTTCQRMHRVNTTPTAARTYLMASN